MCVVGFLCFVLSLSSYFSFASPKEKVSKRKGDFLLPLRPQKKVALRC